MSENNILYSDYPEVTHCVLGNEENVLKAFITADMEHAKSLKTTILVADQGASLNEVINFYRECFSLKEITLNAANIDEALIGFDNGMRVVFGKHSFNTSQMSAEKIALAKVQICDETVIYTHAKSAMHQLLKNHPFVTPAQVVTKLYDINKNLNLGWAIDLANKIIARKTKKILCEKLISEHKYKKACVPLVKIADYTGNGSIFINHSPPGTGKSLTNEDIVRFCIENGLKVLFIAHRRSIIDSNLIDIDGVTHYKKIIPSTESNIKCLKIVVNSLVKPNLRGFLSKVDVVILEEGKQVLSHVSSGSVDRRSKVYDTLKSVCSSARSIIVTDADANDRTLSFVKKTKPLADVQLLYTKGRTNKKTITMMNYQQALAEIETIAGTQPIMIATDCKRQVSKLALKLDEKLNKSGKNKEFKILDIHSDNVNADGQQAFITQPNEHADKYDIIIYSPCITSSLSLVNDHFKIHFGLFQGVLTSSDALQMMLRNRTCSTFLVGIKNPQKRLTDNYNDLLPKKPDEFDQFSSEVKAAENFDRNNITTAFYLSAKNAGFHVVIAGNDRGKISKGKKADNLAAQLESGDFMSRMLKIMKLGCTQTNVNQDIPLADLREYNQIKATTGKSLLAEIDIVNWKRGRLESYVHNLEITRTVRANCLKRDAFESKTGRDCLNITMRHDFFNVIFSILGIDKYSCLGDFTVREANQLVDNLYEQYKDFNKMEKYRFNKQLSYKKPVNATKTVNQILKEFGFEVECRETSPTHGRKRRYSLTAESIKMMNEYTQNRTDIDSSFI